MDCLVPLNGVVYLFIGFSILYFLALSIYRLYLSPVSQFPGPRIAALTFWYEFYFDVYLQGKYAWKIQELHRTYGPLVRINPEELHIDDAGFYDKIYVGNRRTDKWHWSAKMFGTKTAAVGTTDHDMHRLRRAALNPFFSKQSVGHLEDTIQLSIDRLHFRLGSFADSKLPVNLSDAFTAVSGDVISSYTFGKSYNLVEQDGFAPEWRMLMLELSRNTHLMKQFGWAYVVLTRIPETLVGLFHPLSKALFKLRNGISNQVHTIKKIDGNSKLESRQTIFHGLLSSSLPESEKGTPRLTDEGLTIIGAGTVTTAHTLAVIFFHLLSEPKLFSKLQEELASTSQGKSIVHWDDLSNLPYLSAVVSEGLRLSFGVSHRLQRISPDVPLQYKDWTIPAGVPVSMTQMFIMQDADIFPQPKKFIPERWLEPEHRGDGFQDTEFPAPRVAKKFLVPFSRGSRACLGMNLAYAEIFLTIGTLMRPGGLEFDLFETDARDMEIVHDFFNPSPRLDSHGLRVRVKRSDAGAG
ncbi:MutS 4 [Venturia nashicola]|nr:MutS 4 [Venturia nashicola]